MEVKPYRATIRLIPISSPFYEWAFLYVVNSKGNILIVKQKILAETVSKEIAKNGSCDVLKAVFNDINLALDSISYGNWLNLYNFKMLKPAKNTVCLMENK